jgi:S-adenosylmethionine:tRNA ribosyltransferase-isomerase
MHPKQISISDFSYNLPDDKIAYSPSIERDLSKLLIYKDDEITSDIYRNIDAHIPENTFFIFNDTKVIKARLFAKKETGGIIEIFLLEPYLSDYTQAFAASKRCVWQCFVGGAAKWKTGTLQIFLSNFSVSISLVEKKADAFVLEFNWDKNILFAEVLEEVGKTPLPPYIKREAELDDLIRYQTIYAKHNGSVAAPTAGLHFTNQMFKKLQEKKCTTNYVTLHVGAGTFKPVTTEQMCAHNMHAEWIEVNKTFLKNLIDNLENNIIAVGTTSLRTIETLYWLGVKLTINPQLQNLSINQWEVYDDLPTNISSKEALTTLLNYVVQNNGKLIAHTQILIAPGYNFKVANAIVTNFHQPKSTLLLLIAAAVGSNWKRIYEYALQNNFRFLSYGDGSLLHIRNTDT